LTAAQFAAIPSGLLAVVPTFGKIILSQSNRPRQAQFSLPLKSQWRGKVADFALMRRDARKVSPASIEDIVLDATHMGGQRVWQAAPNARVARHPHADAVFGDGREEENLMHDHQ
jgi:hypothetical protein